MKVIIVGGVAGGASTAARLRRLDENCEIVMFERGPYISFANCGLPYYIGNTIKERENLLLKTPEEMSDRFNMDVRVNSEVKSINRENKTISVLDKKSSITYEENYDYLVLSPGSTPIRPRIEGIDAENIFSLWNIPDTDKIKNFVTTKDVKTATVIGGGFIGLEMVENLEQLGIKVNLVEMSNQVMAPIDFEMAQIVHEHLADSGVNMYLSNGVSKFTHENNITNVVLQDGTKLPSDMVILSIGILPNSELAKGCNLPTNKRGGIIVDDHMLTEDKSIYALGDVATVTNYITKEETMIPLAGPANKQGRIVANNLVGRDSVYEGSQGTSVAKIFDLTVSSTGLNEKQLIASGKKYKEDYLINIIEPKDHASYYPGAFSMYLKLIYDLNGKILGAQNIGTEGVEKRIDVIATAIRFGGTIYDLQRLELSYAPPYSSAKDPVNMIGFAAENELNGDVLPIRPEEMLNLDLEKNIIIDVREQLEASLGSIENSINIPVDNIRNEMSKLPKDKTLIVYCSVGLRGWIAARILSQNGFKVKNLVGGSHIYNRYIKDFSKISISNNEPINDKTSIKNNNVEKQIPSELLNTSCDLDNAILLDACGLQCPGPIMKLNKKMENLSDGEIVKVCATDPGFIVDSQAWAKKTGNTFIKKDKEDRTFVSYIQKGSNIVTSEKNIVTNDKNATTMVVFSGDFDKAIASFIIANGAKAMGKDVTLFFTFWGLNILRKTEKVAVKKPFLEKAFGTMMPRGTSKLKLSNMNMLGMGQKMIKHVMNQKNVMPLEQLMKEAIDSGVKIVACTMSMDIMGIKSEELIDGIDYGGVAAYLGAAEDSNHNLFI